MKAQAILYLEEGFFMKRCRWKKTAAFALAVALASSSAATPVQLVFAEEVIADSELKAPIGLVASIPNGKSNTIGFVWG